MRLNPKFYHQLVQDLRSLVFYRDLLELPPMANYVLLLDTITNLNSEIALLKQQYANWNYALLSASPTASWEAWLAGEILRAVNPVTVNPEISAGWQDALTRELEILLRAIRTDGRMMTQTFGYLNLPLYDSGTDLRHVQDEGVTKHFRKMRKKLMNYSPENAAEATQELIAFHKENGYGLPAVFKAMIEDPSGLQGISRLDPILPDDLFDYSGNMEKLQANTEAFIEGRPSTHVLLYGTRGCGKSSAVKSMLNRYESEGLRLIEMNPRHLRGLSDLMNKVEHSPLSFILFIDDLSFRSTDTEYTELKSFLQGGAEDLPANCRLYVTSNRRHLVLEQLDDVEQEMYANDGLDERISLSDRFGLKLHFLKPLMTEYLDVVHFLAAKADVPLPNEELDQAALAYATKVGHRSPREAQVFTQSWLATKDEFL